MAVTNVRYNTEEHVPVTVSYDNGPDVSMAKYPSGTWKDAEVQEWLDAGNTIQPYNQWHGMSLDQVKETGYSQVDEELAKRVDTAQHNPAMGVQLSDSGTKRANAKRDNLAKKKNNGISDADDHLLDHIDELDDFAETLRDQIEACENIPCIEAVIATISTADWPYWSPI